METDRLSYLLRHEATAHGKEDYKHLAADALESLSAEVESLRAELAEAQTVKESLIVALDLFGRHSPKGKPCPVCEAIDNLYDALADSDAARKGEGV